MSFLSLAVGLLPLEAVGAAPAGVVDNDGNGREDLLDEWLAGTTMWEELRETACPSLLGEKSAGDGWPASFEPEAPGAWEIGNLRLLCLGTSVARLTEAGEAALAVGGVCRRLQEIQRFGGVVVCEVDPVGMEAFLPLCDADFVMIDRDGVPALDRSRGLIGADRAVVGKWAATGDWGSSVVVIDSGCDTAHDDLGDSSQDNIDGPPPAVGDARDWYPAEQSWPFFAGYKVVGWKDVSSDYPEAVGPWDYHHHGTALAGVVAGAGNADGDLIGVAPDTRLTIVKFYEFDGIWHQWAGDFLAACAWTLDNVQICRIHVALAAVNWEVDAGISAAVSELAEAGVLPIVAVGNEGLAGTPMGYPAACPDVLTVGAVNDDGVVAAYSNRGENGSGKPDLVAPGGGLLMDRGRITTTDNEPNDSYSGRVGTSLAAAHVAGGAALVIDACRWAGVDLRGSTTGSRTIGALLRATAAPIFEVETDNGLGITEIGGGITPSATAGWGLLQIPAAIEGMLSPVAVGEAVTDTLEGLGGDMVAARRLALLPYGRCRIVVDPQPGLDVSLEAVDLEAIADPGIGPGPVRSSSGGAGVAEEIVFEHRVGEVAVVVVKRLAGEGTFSLSVEALDGLPREDSVSRLAGDIRGWVNVGHLAGPSIPTLVFATHPYIDPWARRVHAVGIDGSICPGWPVSFFTVEQTEEIGAPLVWDLDGVEGDEVAVSSSYGYIYAFTSTGQRSVWDIAADQQRPLTAPVGVIDAGGARLVSVVDTDGVLYLVDADGDIVSSEDLGEGVPLAPAVGQLDATVGEEIAVLLADGTLSICEGEGGLVAGWPQVLAAGRYRDPVLVDWQGVGRHDLVVTLLPDADPGALIYRLFAGDGSTLTGDGTIVRPPEGGIWIEVSAPSIGRDADGLPVVVQIGLAEAGTGEDRIWSLSEIRLAADGGTSTIPVEGFRASATIDDSDLQTQYLQLTPPLVHDYRSAGGSESEYLLAIGWQEGISGLSDSFGQALGWYRPYAVHEGVFGLTPLIYDAGRTVEAGDLSGAVVKDDDGRWCRVACKGETVVLQVGDGRPAATVDWPTRRADGRNTGAAALWSSEPTAVTQGVTLLDPIRLWPNPAASGVWAEVPAGAGGTRQLEVFDLRGRRVRAWSAGDIAREARVFWDGCDVNGRSVAAGSYLFVLRDDNGRSSGRVVLTR